MEFRVRIKEGLDDYIAIKNEEDFDRHLGMGYAIVFEYPVNLENMKIEMKFNTFCSMPAEEIIGIQKWLIENGTDLMEKEYRKASEREIEYERKRKIKEREEREQKKVEKKHNPGYVYLVCAENGYHKIGRAKNIDSRIHNFGVKLPVKTWLVHSFFSENYDKAERALHEKYDKKRDHGEWFMLVEDDVEYIKGIKDFDL